MPVKTKKTATVLKVKTPRKKEKTPIYFEAVGRRKTSVARVRLFEEGKGIKNGILINGKEINAYFPVDLQKKIITAPLEKTRAEKKFFISVKVSGGGINSQSGAIRHGISRALLKFKPEFRQILKPLGFLTRDQRMKERRKFGLKKARKAPQWSKR